MFCFSKMDFQRIAKRATKEAQEASAAMTCWAASILFMEVVYLCGFR
jgi:hypothetical protein